MSAPAEAESTGAEATTYPVNEVYVPHDNIRQFVIPNCVICGQEHWHGSKDRTVARGGMSTRVAHCRPRDAPAGVTKLTMPGEYYLKLADDAEPPWRWYDWVLPEDEALTLEVPAV